MNEFVSESSFLLKDSEGETRKKLKITNLKVKKIHWCGKVT